MRETTADRLPSVDRQRDWAGDYDRNQAELTAAFQLVANRDHWKNAISARVEADADLELIQEAIIHFTGTVPTFERCPSGRVLVKAAGYYAGPCSDC